MIIVDRPLLADRTTLRLGGHALAELCPAKPEDLALLPGMIADSGARVRVMGGGSNLLAADGDLPWVIVRPLFGQDGPAELSQASAQDMGLQARPDEVLVQAGAGLRMPALLAWCAKQGFSGLEGLVGVPGKVGGAVSMNAGAYGQSMEPLLAALEVFGPKKGLHKLLPTAWNCGYRHFSLPGLDEPWHLICQAVLRLKKESPNTVRGRMAQNMATKKASQPLTEHTAGCAFKNPPGASAGKLLEECGLKGKELGGMRFSPKHANFLANTGTGSSAAAMELLALARESVATKTGINLELEIQVWE